MVPCKPVAYVFDKQLRLNTKTLGEIMVANKGWHEEAGACRGGPLNRPWSCRSVAVGVGDEWKIVPGVSGGKLTRRKRGVAVEAFRIPGTRLGPIH